MYIQSLSQVRSFLITPYPTSFLLYFRYTFPENEKTPFHPWSQGFVQNSGDFEWNKGISFGIFTIMDNHILIT